MEFKAVKGTRDFYPDMMRRRNRIIDAWRRVSLRNGFQEYDAPIFEYLDLFTIKSGDEIAEQLFNFTDRGGRQLAIRPEITPSLARMVNAKINSLPKPIKWFSVPRLCRAENPQKGRLREFFQWNIDVIGSDSVLADAECIFVLVDFLREVGLSPDDVQVRIGSRALTIEVLKRAKVPESMREKVIPVLDKRPKISDEAFYKLATEVGLNDEQIEYICRFLDSGSFDEIVEAVSRKTVEGTSYTKEPEQSWDDLERLGEHLTAMGVWDYTTFDPKIIRGLAYYTGIVYEVFDKKQSLRAIAGGGRYDNLLEVLGGPAVGAAGFGMGDVVLGILLDEKGKLPDESAGVDFFVVDDGDEKVFEAMLKMVGELRKRGISADFSYKRANVGKQMKAANRRGAARAVIVRSGGVTVKDMTTGEQCERTLEEFLADLTG